MNRLGIFTGLRRALAPSVRTLLERCGPLRRVALGILRRHLPRLVTIDGDRFHVHPDDFGVTFEITASGDYEPRTRRACLEALEPGGTFVDLGAHVGLYSVPASHRVGPYGRVLAFEPEPANRALLVDNLRLNSCGNVEVVPLAVTDRTGSALLACSTINSGDHRLVATSTRGGARMIECTTLDAFMAKRTGGVDVVKMDIQGGEVQALAGMGSVHRANPALILFIEFSPAHLLASGHAPTELLETLVAMDLAMAVIDEVDGSITPADPDAIAQRCPAGGYLNLRCAPRS